MFFFWIRINKKCIALLPMLLYDVIKHNFWATSAIPLWERASRSHWCTSEPLSVSNLLIYITSLYILKDSDEVIPYYIHISNGMTVWCPLSLSTVSSACLLVLLWSTEGWRQMTNKKERRMWCTVHCIAFCILHSLSSFLRTSL